MESEGNNIRRWRLVWRKETLEKAVDMAQTLLRNGVDKEAFRTFLTACFEHRVISPQDIVQTLGIDKSGPTRWTQEGTSTAPTTPTRVAVVRLVEQKARLAATALSDEIKAEHGTARTPAASQRQRTPKDHAESNERHR